MILIKNHNELLKSDKELFGFLKYSEKTNEFIPVGVTEENYESIRTDSILKLIKKANKKIIFHTHPNVNIPCPSIEDYILSLMLIQDEHIEMSVVVTKYGYVTITMDKKILAIDLPKFILKLLNKFDKFDDWWSVEDHIKFLKRFGINVSFVFLKKQYDNYLFKYDKKIKTKMIEDLMNIYIYNYNVYRKFKF